MLCFHPKIMFISWRKTYSELFFMNLLCSAEICTIFAFPHDAMKLLAIFANWATNLEYLPYFLYSCKLKVSYWCKLFPSWSESCMMFHHCSLIGTLQKSYVAASWLSLFLLFFPCHEKPTEYKRNIKARGRGGCQKSRGKVSIFAEWCIYLLMV